MAASTLETLTPRQIEILDLVSKGLTNQEICKLLEISSNTVKVHVAAILKSLEVANRTQATSVYKQLSTTAKQPNVQARVMARIGRPAIAVLPMRLLSGDDTDHVLEGLTEELITHLSGWRWFPVIAHASTQHYGADKEIDLARIRHELHARYLISSSVRRSQQHARITVHLLETEHGQGLWSNSYDLDLKDALVMQEVIARSCVARIAPELLDIEARIHPSEAHLDFDAWQTTMNGLWHLSKRTHSEVDRAEKLFQRAIQQDPDFALPWFGMVWVYHNRLVEQWQGDVPDLEGRIAEAAEACASLDPKSASSQTVLGLTNLLQGDAQRAEAHLQHAARINPSSTQALSLLGQCYCLSGREDECIAMLEEALTLNPVGPNVWSQQAVIALAHFAAQRYDEAIFMARETLASRPNSITGYLVLMAVNTERNETEQAREHFRELLNLRPGFQFDQYLKLIAPTALPHQIERLNSAFFAVQ